MQLVILCPADDVVGGAFFYSAGGVQVAHGQLYIPYAGVAIAVLALAAIFRRAYVPDLIPSEGHVPESPAVSSPSVSIWVRPHFIGSVLAQFLYVAAQAGIFSFFINYIVSETPPLADGTHVTEQGAARLQGLLGFGLFLLGRLTGTALLGKVAAHRLLGIYSLINSALCTIVVMKVGWISVAAVFLCFFFMSITFPTIFALGITDLGAQAKKASAFIVMAILGGAIMPKLMGYLGDVYNMSVAFLMPLGCFAAISLYGFMWAALVRTKDEHALFSHR